MPMPMLTGHGGMPMDNEDDDVQDIYVDQDDDEQGLMPGGHIQSLQMHTQRGESLYCTARQSPRNMNGVQRAGGKFLPGYFLQ